MPVSFSLSFLPDVHPDKSAGMAKLAEDKGFKIAWVPDSQLLWRDVYVSMTACAYRTSKIKLATAVTTPVLRHFAVTAGAITSVNEVSKGRAILGIGTGDSAVYTMGMKPASVETLRETILRIRDLLNRREINYNGKMMKMEWDVSPVPIYIAAAGPRALQTAGEVADGVVLLTGVHPSFMKYALDNLTKGAERAGRKLQDLDIWLWTGLAISDDRRKARDEARAFAAGCLSFMVRIPKTELPPELIAEGEKFKEAYNYSQHMVTDAHHAELATDDQVDRFALSGTVEDCIEKIKVVEKSGINKIAVNVFTARDKKGLVNAFSKNVMSRFK